MRKLKEEGVRRKEYALAWAVSARNTLEMIGGYTSSQKVFGKTHHTMRDACIEDMTVTELEGQVDSRKLKEILESKELIRKTYQGVECRERIKRDPGAWSRIGEERGQGLLQKKNWRRKMERS